MEKWTQNGRAAVRVALFFFVVAVFCAHIGMWRVAAAAAAQEGLPEVSPTPRPEIEPALAEELTFAQWMEKARAGDLEAQCNVGVFYVNGQGVPRDYPEGLAWLYRAGNAGYSHAQFLLAGLYSQGFGATPSDPFRAWFWAALAAASQDIPDQDRQLAVKMMAAVEKDLSAKHLASVQRMAKDWSLGRAAAPR